MKSIADQLPPDIARQIHPDWRKNEAAYWAVRDKLLSQYQGQWIGFADGGVIASGTSPVAVFHAAEASGRHPFVTCVGREDEPCRMRHIDRQQYPCRLQADFVGHERILGRDVLNHLETLFRGPSGEVVVNSVVQMMGNPVVLDFFRFGEFLGRNPRHKELFWCIMQEGRHLSYVGRYARLKMRSSLLPNSLRLTGSIILEVKAQQLRRELRRQFLSASEKVDVIITPTTAIAAPRLDAKEYLVNGQPVPFIRAIGGCTFPGSLTGLPVESLPCGFTTSGLPIGTQIMPAPLTKQRPSGRRMYMSGQPRWPELGAHRRRRWSLTSKGLSS